METIKIKVGKSSIITLKSLAAAGYLWSYEVEKKDVVSVSEDRLATASGKAKPGESFPERFSFRALKPGTAKVVFSQKRSWEQNKAAIAIQIFTVIVS